MAANALKVIDDGVMLRSEANLVASVGAGWGPRARKAAASILARIAAEEEARTTREVAASLPDASGAMLDEAAARFSAQVLERGGSAGQRTLFTCPKVHLFALSEWLVSQGATRVSVAEADYIFTASNPLVERLEARIG